MAAIKTQAYTIRCALRSISDTHKTLNYKAAAQKQMKANYGKPSHIFVLDLHLRQQSNARRIRNTVDIMANFVQNNNSG